MRNYRQMLKTLVASASVATTAVLMGNYWTNSDRPENVLKASWTNSYEPASHVKWDFNWDRRGASSVIHPKHRYSVPDVKKTEDKDAGQSKSSDDSQINKHSTKASRHLFLIRHGQYEWQREDPKNHVLTPLGRDQADFTGKRLKELTKDFNFTKIHHSTMPRAIETADIIRKSLPSDLPVSVDPMLCEGAPIPPEPPVGHWRPETYKFFEDGSRIEAAFRKYFHRAPPEQLDDSYEIIVCHANVIRYFFCRALQFPAEGWLRIGLNHGSITHIVIRPDGRVACKTLGDYGFQPVAKASS